uniref:Uncharacterized protein n=1 Tax=Cacopsylla melanoneura TaxID=428564 RepID=A0A8D8ZED8_9HEMI
MSPDNIKAVSKGSSNEDGQQIGNTSRVIGDGGKHTGKEKSPPSSSPSSPSPPQQYTYQQYPYPMYHHSNYVPLHTLPPSQTLSCPYNYPSLGARLDMSPNNYHCQPPLNSHCHASFMAQYPNFQVFPTSLLV